MMSVTIRWVLTVLLCLTWVGCSSVVDDDEVVERVKVGDHIPAFTIDVVTPTLADGQWSKVEGQWSSQRLTGETVIVFFNTSCQDCQRDLPLLNEYYLQHKDKAGFQMVAISREEGEASVAAFWAAHQLQIPYSAQEDRHIYQLFASSIIPRIYFVSPQGIVTRYDVERFAI